MNWRFWKRKNDTQDQIDSGICTQTEDPANSGLKEEKLPDISEPVMKIIKAMETRPKNFQITQTEFTGRSDGYYAEYNGSDRLTGLKVNIIHCLHTYGVTKIIKMPFDLTDEESCALWDAAEKMMRSRISKVKKYKNRKSRKAWTEKYDSISGLEES